MSRKSNSLEDKPSAVEMERVISRDEETGVGLKETTTSGTTNEVNFSFIMTMLGFSMTFVVAEATPLFLITVFTIIAFDLNAAHYVIWILVSQLIAIAAIAPFVGTLSDLLGRKAITLVSLGLTIIGMILIGATPNIAGFLAGQVVLGLSIGIQLLTSIAAVTELVPTNRRGITIGYVVCGFIPFAPASLYGQYIAAHNWRYIPILLGGWAAIAFVVLAIFYRPPPRENSLGLTKQELLGRIDYIGSFLSIVGLVVFLMGLNWGGQDYAWSSTPVITTLTLGLALLVGFFLWEMFGAKYPMFPRRLADSPKMFTAVSILCLTSGINYIPVVVFFVIQSYTVYEASFTQAGIYLLPIGFCIAGGAIISAVLLTMFPKKIHIILITFCVCQTAGLGCMAAVDPENINTVWAPLIIGLIGVGGVLLPSQVVFSIITPNDLLGTGVALSVVIRLIGQVIGVSMFYNIFVQQVTKNVWEHFIVAAVTVGIATEEAITELVNTLAAGPLSHYVHLFPKIDTPEKLAMIVQAGHDTYRHSFPLLYLIAIAFGGAAIIASLFLKDLDKYMNDTVAVML